MIYLIITTCIENRYGLRNDEHRRQTYLSAIASTLSRLPAEITPVIVENNGERPTYLDELGIPVIYTNNNAQQHYHKGLNELDDIMAAMDHLHVGDEDLVIKLTGRYEPTSDQFFKFLLEHESTYDAFLKFFNVCTLQFLKNDCVLGLFALRAKYMRAFAGHSFAGHRSMEVEFATFVREQVPPARLLEVETLGLRCCFADNLRMLDV